MGDASQNAPQIQPHVQPKTSGMAIASLVCGILAIQKTTEVAVLLRGQA